MTDLERRALLGDRQAQEECTRNEIVLPCPCCGGREIETKHACEDYWCECVKCGTAGGLHCRKSVAIAKWNTRQAPPIGRCVECAKRKTSECEMYFSCNCGEQHTWETDNDFCSGFAPEDGEENAEI